MSKAFREEAMPFIMFNDTTKRKNAFNHALVFEINPEAVNMISNLDQPLGVLSVAGMYRTGKSYLLNKMLLNTKKGFGVGPSVNPCTKVSLRYLNILGALDLGKTNKRHDSRGQTNLNSRN